MFIYIRHHKCDSLFLFNYPFARIPFSFGIMLMMMMLHIGKIRKPTIFFPYYYFTYTYGLFKPFLSSIVNPYRKNPHSFSLDTRCSSSVHAILTNALIPHRFDRAHDTFASSSFLCYIHACIKRIERNVFIVCTIKKYKASSSECYAVMHDVWDIKIHKRSFVCQNAFSFFFLAHNVCDGGIFVRVVKLFFRHIQQRWRQYMNTS